MSPNRAAYAGNTRQLLIALDVGTTFSGISYSILDPGKKPQIRGVNKFPGQEKGDAKIPSVIYYSKIGEIRAIGAEAVRDGIDILAEEEEWVRIEWFKLHLDPSRKQGSPEIPPLAGEQVGKTPVDIFADFLKYLNDVAKQYIEENHPLVGTSVWGSGQIHYILSHPNGWAGKQQNLLRQAAEKAGLITKKPNTRKKVTFVTEGEASLNRCIERGLLTDPMVSSGEGVVIVDAGGGTIDVSAYSRRQDGRAYEEIAESQCHMMGSIFVTRRHAKAHLEERFAGTRYLEDIPQLLRVFDRSAKCTFRDPGDPHFLSITSRKRNDPNLGIKARRLRLEGATVASFFEQAIQCIISSVLLQQKITHKRISNVFLVGGFSGNDYLLKRVKDELAKHGLTVWRPDTQCGGKAVANGAVSGIVDHPVQVRVSRRSYGIKCTTRYIGQNKEHKKRKNQSYDDYWSGNKMLRGLFNTILARNTQVSETQEFRRSFTRNIQNVTSPNIIHEVIHSYQGSLLSTDYLNWVDNDPSNFQEVCKVRIDLARLPKSSHIGQRGRYYKVAYDVVLRFGLTELEAQVVWTENGIEKRGPVKIIYDTKP